MPLIEVKNLTLGYENRTVIEDLNFSVDEGDYLCIVGENGSGKSTLMKTLLGLQKPFGGEIIFGDGLDRREIGYLPQQTIVQKDFPASVREIVLSGCQSRCGLRPFYNRDEKLLAEKVDFRPAHIIEELDLRRPIYRQTAAYGHFGRDDLDLPWEKLDLAERFL